ncbi:hypothetical protein BX666DRAFT_2030709 [Dichotomocladium elegans]|nr:hypothetical protein BX666DRAFT_2030709 [Dichotomocladium elegans]
MFVLRIGGKIRQAISQHLQYGYPLSSILSRLDGKVAVITGAARGIGKAVAVELVNRGAKVMIGDVMDKDGEETVKELNALAGTRVAAYRHTDVSVYKDNVALFRAAEEEFGGIAHLNAGIVKGGDNIFMSLDDEADARVVNVNMMGVIKGTKVALLHLAKRGGGVIIITSSVTGFYTDLGPYAYNASKHGVIGWLKSFQMMPAICNVRVNAICPHGVRTSIDPDFPEEMRDVMAEITDFIELTSIDTVVRAVTGLIEDETANCKAMLVLPGDVVREQEPLPPLPEIYKNEAFVDFLVTKMAPAKIAHSKKELAAALEAYDKYEI